MAVTETSTHPPLRHAHAATRRGLPGPVRAQVRVPWVETAVYLPLVPLAFLPLLLATAAAVATLAALAATTGAVATLLAVQRIVVGDDYVAARRLHGYRVVPASEITAIRARPSQRGGTLRIDVGNARPLATSRRGRPPRGQHRAAPPRRRPRGAQHRRRHPAGNAPPQPARTYSPRKWMAQSLTSFAPAATSTAQSQVVRDAAAGWTWCCYVMRR